MSGHPFDDTLYSEDFLLLPDHVSAKNALLKIEEQDAESVVVYRPVSGDYFLFDYYELQKKLEVGEAHRLLGDILTLHKRPPTPAISEGEIEGYEENEMDFVVVETRSVEKMAIVKGALASVSVEEVVLIGVPDDRGHRSISDGKADSFEAYPRLDAPETVKPKETFDVFVGFRDSADTSLATAEKIFIDAPPPEANIMVSLAADGAKVLKEDGFRMLPLNLETATVYSCVADEVPPDGIIRLTAKYYYQFQCVGMGQREIQVGSSRSLEKTEVKQETPALNLNDKELHNRKVDLTITVTRGKGNSQVLDWDIVAANPPIARSFQTEVADTKVMAKIMDQEFGQYKYTSKSSNRILHGMGQVIADCMPEQLLDPEDGFLKRVCEAKGSTPTLLLITNEPHIPWELAQVPDPQDPEAPPFLAAQTHMGRWWAHPRVSSPPPKEIEINKITAVAAEYRGSKALVEALEERDFLKHDFQANAVEADFPTMDALLSEDVEAGHLIHIALHGRNNASSDEQSLLLKDNQRLHARAFAGHYKPGEPPQFSFVFLNACQVGAAGEVAGQYSGFPGVLLRNGTLGFIAPLWKVDDTIARGIAEAFYKDMLTVGKMAGKVLLNERKKYTEEGNVTPMAYVFYGHPELRLIHNL